MIKVDLGKFQHVIVNRLKPTTMVIIFREFLTLYQIFLSPQVKQRVIVNSKHGIYELPHELPNVLTLGS